MADDPEDEALKRACRDARFGLEHRLDELDDIDDKAMRNVRTAVLVLGLLVSVGGYAGPESVATLPDLVHWLYGIGAALLLGSIFAGVGVYVASDLEMGVSPGDLREVLDGKSATDWSEFMVRGYANWIDEMDEEIEENQGPLSISTALMVGALVALALASGFSIILTYHLV